MVLSGRWESWREKFFDCDGEWPPASEATVLRTVETRFAIDHREVAAVEATAHDTSSSIAMQTVISDEIYNVSASFHSSAPAATI